MFDLREGGASAVGDKSSVTYYRAGQTFARSSDGRIIIRLYDTGLENEQTAVASIAHELNHVRSALRTGETSSEDDAELAAIYAEENFK